MNIAKCPGNRHELFAGRFHGIDVLTGQRGWRPEILFALENKHRDGEFQAKPFRAEGLGLRHEHVCKDLAIEVVV